MSRVGPIDGIVAPGFERVRDAFARNFELHDELGAACAAYVDGAEVVSLLGGWHDRGRTRRWQPDTLALVFSCAKGITAAALAVACSRGWLDYDAPIARSWPEFGRNGKARITLRQVLDHTAGLPAIDTRLTAAEIADRAALRAAIERQRPAWPPGTRRGYDYLTMGWIAAEVLRRADPAGRSLHRFVVEEVAAPLGVELLIGAPEEAGAGRVASIAGFHAARMLLHLHTMPAGMVLDFFRPGSLTARTLGNPRLSNPAELDGPVYRRLELPAANGYASATGLARLFSALLSPGGPLNLAARVVREIGAPLRTPPRPHDLIWHSAVAFSLGFLKPTRTIGFGSDATAFGTEGAGGAFAYADPATRAAFAYVPNRMGLHLHDAPRQRAVRLAFERALRRRA